MSISLWPQMHPARANSVPNPAGTALGCQVQEGVPKDTRAATSLRHSRRSSPAGPALSKPGGRNLPCRWFWLLDFLYL